MFTLCLRRAFNLLLGLSLATCTFSTGSTDAILYGNLPQLIDLPQQTLTAWIDVTALSDHPRTIMSGWVTNVGGIQFGVTGSTGQLFFIQTHVTQGGQWKTSASTVPNSQWIMVAVSVSNGAVPRMYVSGASLAVTEIVPAIGDVGSINGMDWTVGNLHGNGADVQLTTPFAGRIKDPRVYNRILTYAEISTINSEGVGGTSVTDGLVFQGDCVRTDDISIYNGATLTSETKLLDNIYGAVGTPHGASTCTIP